MMRRQRNDARPDTHYTEGSARHVADTRATFTVYEAGRFPADFGALQITFDAP